MVINVSSLDKQIRESLRSAMKLIMLQKNGTLILNDVEVRSAIGKGELTKLQSQISEYYQKMIGVPVSCRLSEDDCVDIYNNRC